MDTFFQNFFLVKKIEKIDNVLISYILPLILEQKKPLVAFGAYKTRFHSLIINDLL